MCFSSNVCEAQVVGRFRKEEELQTYYNKHSCFGELQTYYNKHPCFLYLMFFREQLWLV